MKPLVVLVMVVLLMATLFGMTLAGGEAFRDLVNQSRAQMMTRESETRLIWEATERAAKLRQYMAEAAEALRHAQAVNKIIEDHLPHIIVASIIVLSVSSLTTVVTVAYVIKCRTEVALIRAKQFLVEAELKKLQARPRGRTFTVATPTPPPMSMGNGAPPVQQPQPPQTKWRP
jgi:hypothetical protein